MKRYGLEGVYAHVESCFTIYLVIHVPRSLNPNTRRVSSEQESAHSVPGEVQYFRIKAR